MDMKVIQYYKTLHLYSIMFMGQIMVSYWNQAVKSMTRNMPYITRVINDEIMFLLSGFVFGLVNSIRVAGAACVLL